MEQSPLRVLPRKPLNPLDAGLARVAVTPTPGRSTVVDRQSIPYGTCVAVRPAVQRPVPGAGHGQHPGAAGVRTISPAGAQAGDIAGLPNEPAPVALVVALTARRFRRTPPLPWAC